ncbi:A1pp-domain-containing protein [Dioszegia hungarica]|uniref:A1pp-domain-containing protein n=1 Tax=Dioszegia hungarica TaxID=4972 RepID=A0AA38H261_9TREE|nr:A1pp-domain-containing protein [Dioszegia hungarica]KAI9632723.1 A1pp-domain-containing protein [Dioszegia hungarica]
MPSPNKKEITDVGDIPTLHDLYASKELTPLSEAELIDEMGDAEGYAADESLNKRVSIWRGDITVLKASMIVNAANSSLLGGGGVDGAIHRAAGDELYEECKTLGGAETGETKVTGAYDLPSTFIAHTVGPIYSTRNPGQSQDQLESCYRTSLEHCQEKKAETIGFSSISTGIYGYPIGDATHVALEQTRIFLEKDDSIKRVIYVVFSAKDERVYRSLAPIYFPTPAAPAADSAAEPAVDAAAETAPETRTESQVQPQVEPTPEAETREEKRSAAETISEAKA